MTDKGRESRELQMPMNTLDQMGDDEPIFFNELKHASWNILYENPGTDYSDWIAMLTEQYPAEVVDALGSDPNEVYPALADLWDTGCYEDAETGECHTFKEWAEYFATNRSIELYNMPIEAKREISRLEALKFPK